MFSSQTFYVLGPLQLKESINRWLGVTLYYENAWRDKKTGQWIDASFHFLEQVEFHKPGQEINARKETNGRT
jgi:hypothetical protein